MVESYIFASFPPKWLAGYTEIVQLLISHANEPERVKRMLETVDTEGDTVSLWISKHLDLHSANEAMIN